jgi:hypothetical protein
MVRIMTFPGYPLAENAAPGKPVRGSHAGHHEALETAVNSLQDQITALGPGLAGADGREVEFQTTATHVQWRYVDTPPVAWTDLIALADLEGAPGEEVSMQATATHLQWRLGSGSWTNLVELATLAGPVITASGGLRRVGDDIRPDEIHVYWETGDETAKLDADEVFTDAAGDTATTWTRTIVTADPPNFGSDALGPRRLRVSCPTGMTGANTRICLPLMDTAHTVNDEIESTWWQKTPGAQAGHFHRLGLHAGDPIIAIAWHDVLFGQDDDLNANTWKTDLATRSTLGQGSANGSGVVSLSGVQKNIPILASKKEGTTVTLTVPYGHGLAVTNTILVETEGIFDGVVAITAVSATTVTYTSPTTSAAAVWFGGPGALQSLRTVWPLKFKSQMVGDVLRAKMWRPAQEDEPPWSDEFHAIRFENTSSVKNSVAGKSGIYVGHLATDVSFVEYGDVHWKGWN